MAAPETLSEQDLGAARAELAAGRPFPVWFTDAAVGVPAGGSAKVVSVGDVTEGDFVEVRPTGSRDTVFCSPNELTRVRPPRKKAAAGKPADGRPADGKAAAGGPAADGAAPPAARGAATAATAAGEAADPPAPRRAGTGGSGNGRAQARSGAAPSAPAPSGAAAAGPGSGAPSRGSAPGAAPAGPSGAGARGAGQARAPRAAEVTVTLASTAEGEWTVEVTTGRKRTVRPTPVQPAEVAKAARSLPPAVAEAIESSLAAARQRQAERVERLRAELDAAQRALQELTG